MLFGGKIVLSQANYAGPSIGFIMPSQQRGRYTINVYPTGSYCLCPTSTTSLDQCDSGVTPGSYLTLIQSTQNYVKFQGSNLAVWSNEIFSMQGPTLVDFTIQQQSGPNASDFSVLILKLLPLSLLMQNFLIQHSQWY